MRPAAVRKATRLARARIDFYVPDLTRAAEAMLAEAASLAADRFREKATVHITAAGDEPPGWTPPADDELLTIDELIAMYRGKTDPVRQAAISDYFNTFGGAVRGSEPTVYTADQIPADLEEAIIGWPEEASDVAGAAILEAEEGTGELYVLRDARGEVTAIANVERGGDSLIVHNIASSGGRGQGTALLRSIARDASASNLGVRLVSTPEAVPYYERHGFDVGEDRTAHLPAGRAAAFGGEATGIRANWELTNPLISGLLDRVASNVTSVSNTTREGVRAVMLRSYEAGLSVPDTASAIQAAMAEASPARATLIARTEYAGLQNGGALTAVSIVAKATDEAYMKQWLTAPGAEYPRHEDYEGLDGQTVALEESFDVGGESLMYPGDPDGEPSEVCNCRCDMTFVTPKEAEEEAATAAGHPQAALRSGGPMKGNGNQSGELEIQIDRSASQLQWQATLLVEGEPTDDGRMIEPGALDWRDLPLSLMAMVETADGHTGATVAGRIDQIWRDGNRVMGAGVFDGGEFGQEIARLVDESMLRGISVDLAIREYEYRPKDGEEAITEEDLLDLLFGGADMLFVVTDGSIGAATVCPFPAFADAEIALVASSPLTWRATRQHGMTVVQVEARGPDTADGADPDDALIVTASAAGLVPVRPPAEWFEDPKLEEATPLTITDDGRIYGHAAAWNVCHIGFDDACVLAPRSETDYRFFLLGEVEVELPPVDDPKGEQESGAATIPCGQVTLGTGHASLSLTRQAAVEHYDDSGTVAAHVACGEDEFGIWFAGALAPDLSEERVRELRGAKISGDWRNVEGNLELVAMLAVNVPGFPVPRVRVASADAEPIAAALVSAGVADRTALDAMEARAKQQREMEELAAEASGELDDLAAEARGAEVAAGGPFVRP